VANSVLWQLVSVFAPLSLLTIGGGQSILADVYQQTVTRHHWLTPAQFVDDYAISRAAPGPASLLVTLIGWQVAGVAGALVASIAIFVPSSILFYGFAVFWLRHSHQGRWREKLARGLAPVSVGLVFAGSYSILTVNDGGVLGWVVTGASLLVLLVSKVHPFVLLLGGAATFLLSTALGY
jgi:chromate transporter